MNCYLRSLILSKVSKSKGIVNLLQKEVDSPLVNALETYLVEIECLLDEEG